MPDPMQPMNLSDWFDPYDYSHVMAYNHLIQNGEWPMEFVPDNVMIDPLHLVKITGKIADAWIDAMKRGIISAKHNPNYGDQRYVNEMVTTIQTQG